MAELYFRENPVAIDYTDLDDIKKHSKPLTSFDDLSEALSGLQKAFDEELKSRNDIIINAFPDIDGVVELSVFHQVKRKLFSKKLKSQRFVVCATLLSELFILKTTSFEEVKEIFQNFVEHQKAPSTFGWENVKLNIDFEQL